MCQTACTVTIGFIMVTVNYTALFLIFPSRYRKIHSIALIIGCVAAFYIVLILTGMLNTTYGAIRGLLHLPLVVFLFRGQFFQKLFAHLSVTLISGLLFLPANTAACYFRPATGFNYYLFLFVFLINAGYIAFLLKYGRHLFARLFVSGSRSEWAMYSAGAAFSVALYAIFVVYPIDTWQLMTIFAFILWSFAVLCFAIVKTHEKTKEKDDAEFVRSIISACHKHYQKMNEMYDKLRTLRHDYKYHLIVAQKMLQSGTAEKAEEYLNCIETQLSKHDMEKYCSNAVINALVISYAERCKRLGIKFNVRISIPESLNITDYDMCIIFGNLLENAVEACSALEHNRVIELDAHCKSSQFLLMIRNSFNGIVCKDNGSIVSTKTNGGFGLRSVTRVIECQGDDLITEWEGKVFTVYAAVKL